MNYIFFITIIILILNIIYYLLNLNKKNEIINLDTILSNMNTRIINQKKIDVETKKNISQMKIMNNTNDKSKILLFHDYDNETVNDIKKIIPENISFIEINDNSHELNDYYNISKIPTLILVTPRKDIEYMDVLDPINIQKFIDENLKDN